VEKELHLRDLSNLLQLSSKERHLLENMPRYYKLNQVLEKDAGNVLKNKSRGS